MLDERTRRTRKEKSRCVGCIGTRCGRGSFSRRVDIAVLILLTTSWEVPMRASQLTDKNCNESSYHESVLGWHYSLLSGDVPYPSSCYQATPVNYLVTLFYRIDNAVDAYAPFRFFDGWKSSHLISTKR